MLAAVADQRWGPYAKAAGSTTASVASTGTETPVETTRCRTGEVVAQPRHAPIGQVFRLGDRLPVVLR